MIISKTPLRISFVGGGSDLPAYYKKNTGSVISTTINKYVYVIVKKRFDNKIYINYSKKEIVSEINEIQHSLVRECLIETGITHGIEITTLSDIPSEGSGLGSSSAITVGLLNALYNYKNILLSKVDLAKKACIIEIDKCKNPIGKQDQYGCALGGFNQINFYKNDKVKFFKFDNNFLDFEKCLYLCYTGITRSANKILKTQSENSESKSEENLKLLSGVKDFKKIILSNSFENTGELLDRMWKIKKGMSEGISNQQIDNLYYKGIEAGAQG
ncbi:MAG: GHMP kinase, partial [Candidatus Woesearchaeota archaeon]